MVIINNNNNKNVLSINLWVRFEKDETYIIIYLFYEDKEIIFDRLLIRVKSIKKCMKRKYNSKRTCQVKLSKKISRIHDT